MESPHFQDGKKVKDKASPNKYGMVVIFKRMVASNFGLLMSLAAMVLAVAP